MHFSKRKWKDYVQNRISAPEREVMDRHLYSCESCLKWFMECVEQHMPPVVHTPVDEEKMVRIIHEERRQTGQTNQRWSQQRMWQYFIAAGITIVLMSGGVFDTVVTSVSKWEEQTVRSRDSVISDTLMNKTVAMLDELDQKLRGGEHIE